jgi:hypothetical protein
VKLREKSSWRLAESDGSRLHLALCIRDAGGLNVPNAGDVPPALIDPPDPISSLGVPGTSLAGRQWLEWWRSLLLLEERQHAGEPGVQFDRQAARQFVREAQRVFDPPNFDSLIKHPELQVIAKIVAGKALNHRHGEVSKAPSAHFTHDEMATAASLSSLSNPAGIVVTLNVVGVWFCIPKRGLALCSSEALEDPQARRMILTHMLVQPA